MYTERELSKENKFKFYMVNTTHYLDENLFLHVKLRT